MVQDVLAVTVLSQHEDKGEPVETAADALLIGDRYRSRPWPHRTTIDARNWEMEYKLNHRKEKGR